MVFQGAMSALNPVQTVGDQIAEPILLHEKVGEKDGAARAPGRCSTASESRRAGWTATRTSSPAVSDSA